MDEKGQSLFKDLNIIFSIDPLIDEIGIVPSTNDFYPNVSMDPVADPTSNFQSQTNLSAELSATIQLIGDPHSFWLHEHKLALAVSVLQPLYNFSKNLFLKLKLKLFDQDAEDIEEIMNCTRALVIINGDHRTAWKMRRKIISVHPIPKFSHDPNQVKNDSKFLQNEVEHHQIGSEFLSLDAFFEMNKLIYEEFKLTWIVLSKNAKYSEAWLQRKWLIQHVAKNETLKKANYIQEIIQNESHIVHKIVEISSMNYRAWNHRLGLIKYMSMLQVKNELQKYKSWCERNVENSSAFHYRRSLLLRYFLFSFVSNLNDETHHCINGYEDEDILHSIRCCHMATSADAKSSIFIWKEEWNWNEMLIKSYTHRESLWIHRRFLFHLFVSFLLHLSHSFPSINDNERGGEEEEEEGEQGGEGETNVKEVYIKNSNSEMLIEQMKEEGIEFMEKGEKMDNERNAKNILKMELKFIESLFPSLFSPSLRPSSPSPQIIVDKKDKEINVHDSNPHRNKHRDEDEDNDDGGDVYDCKDCGHNHRNYDNNDSNCINYGGNNGDNNSTNSRYVEGMHFKFEIMNSLCPSPIMHVYSYLTWMIYTIRKCKRIIFQNEGIFSKMKLIKSRFDVSLQQNEAANIHLDEIWKDL